MSAARSPSVAHADRRDHDHQLLLKAHEPRPLMVLKRMLCVLIDELEVGRLHAWDKRDGSCHAGALMV